MINASQFVPDSFPPNQQKIENVEKKRISQAKSGENTRRHRKQGSIKHRFCCIAFAIVVVVAVVVAVASPQNAALYPSSTLALLELQGLMPPRFGMGPPVRPNLKVKALSIS